MLTNLLCRCLWRYSQVPSGCPTWAASLSPSSSQLWPHSYWLWSSQSLGLSGLCVYSYFTLLFQSICSRYFFGLPTPKGSCIPGKTCQGFLPCIILGISAFAIWLSVYLFAKFDYCKSVPTSFPCLLIGSQWTF